MTIIDQAKVSNSPTLLAVPRSYSGCDSADRVHGDQNCVSGFAQLSVLILRPWGYCSHGHFLISPIAHPLKLVSLHPIISHDSGFQFFNFGRYCLRFFAAGPVKALPRFERHDRFLGRLRRRLEVTYEQNVGPRNASGEHDHSHTGADERRYVAQSASGATSNSVRARGRVMGY